MAWPISEPGVQRIRDDEGCHDRTEDGRFKAYQRTYVDKASGKVHVDVPTIGYGSTKGVRMGMIWTLEECEAALQAELAEKAIELERLVKVPTNQNEKDAIQGFVFNVGVGAFAGSTMLKLLNAGDKAGAAAEFPKWRLTGGVVSQGLINRRAREMALFSRPMADEPHKVGVMPQTVDPPVEPPKPMLTPAQKTAGGALLITAAQQGAEVLLTPPPAVAVQTVDNLSAWHALGVKASNLGAALWSSPEAMAVAVGLSLACVWLPVAWRRWVR
jgi:lysozyme